MTLNLSIKNVPEAVAQRLRARAERNHRSLQGELLAIVEQAAQEFVAPERPSAGPAGPAGNIPRGVVTGSKTIEDLMAERAARPPLVLAPDLPRAVDIIRADRDSR
jgi:hypothetical protein